MPRMSRPTSSTPCSPTVPATTSTNAHPEYSTPECSNALEVVVHDRAGELILRRSMEAANRLLPAGDEIVIYKNNSDGKGNSYGCHENYLLDRAVLSPGSSTS